jgi:hypothetical protein
MAKPVPLSRLALELGINPRKWFGMPAPPKPKGISQRRIDNYVDNLRQVQGVGGYLKEISRDRRTIRSVQRLTRELISNARPKEIAAELGMSTQRWTAIRKKIESGQAYSPELRESLKQAVSGAVPDHETRDAPGGRVFDYFPNDTKLNRLIPWCKKVTPRGFSDIDQAAKWWETIGGGAEYFVISASTSKKTGRKIYNVYEIRTAAEIKNKGRLKNVIRAREIIEKEYGKK